MTTTNSVRTDMYCHACHHNFIATLDFSIEGDHEIQCPYCCHLHLRTIRDGKVTETRWGSSAVVHKVPTGCVWKCDSRPMVTSTAASFIREKWLNREDAVPA